MAQIKKLEVECMKCEAPEPTVGRENKALRVLLPRSGYSIVEKHGYRSFFYHVVVAADLEFP